MFWSGALALHPRRITCFPFCSNSLSGAPLALPRAIHHPRQELTWIVIAKFWRQARWWEGRGPDAWSRRDPVEEENEMRTAQSAERKTSHWATGPQVVGQEDEVTHESRSEPWRKLLSVTGVMGYSAEEGLLRLLNSSISPMRSSTKSQPSRSCHVLPVNMETDHPRDFLSQPLVTGKGRR